MPKFRFKRTSEEPVVEPQPEKVNKGVPSYARFHQHRVYDSPVYDKTGEFLKMDPLEGIPIGALALAPRNDEEWEAIGQDLTGDYNVFPWEESEEPPGWVIVEDLDPAVDDDGVIINEEKLP